jgi:superfamily II DNA or RNA helicase
VIFQEGIDIPALRSVIIGTGGKSTIASLQRIGRGMRMAEGKHEFEVWDVLDQGQKWLKAHALGRFQAYGREGHEVVVLQPGDLELLAASRAGARKAAGA